MSHDEGTQGHAPVSGWYPSPTMSGMEEYYNGAGWSGQTRPSGNQTAIMPQPPTTAVSAPPPTAPPTSFNTLTPPPPAYASAPPPTPLAANTGLASDSPFGHSDVPPFHFDGKVGSYLGVSIIAALVVIFSFGLATPFAFVLVERWKARHTYIEGRRLMFTGTGFGLFGRWLLWMLLTFVTFGIYSFWVFPALTKWRVENLAFDPSHTR